MKDVKIIQILLAPNDYKYQGALFGLGSDGIVYHADSDNKWHVYIRCEFANVDDDSNK